MKKTIPNILSMSRIVIAPLFLVLFISNNKETAIWSLILFAIGALTDYFDGWLARKMQATSKLGGFFDPLADKFLTTAAFLAFVLMKIIPFWMLAVIVLRDFGTTFLRLMPSGKNVSIVTSKSAKTKTFIQMLFISVLIGLHTMKFMFEDPNLKLIIDNIIYSPIIYFTMLGITILSAWTLVEYIYQYRKNTKKKLA